MPKTATKTAAIFLRPCPPGIATESMGVTVRTSSPSTLRVRRHRGVRLERRDGRLGEPDRRRPVGGVGGDRDDRHDVVRVQVERKRLGRRVGGLDGRARQRGRNGRKGELEVGDVEALRRDPGARRRCCGGCPRSRASARRAWRATRGCRRRLGASATSWERDVSSRTRVEAKPRGGVGLGPSA